MSTQLESNKSKIAVVIPCYREKDHILDVLAAMGPEITSIFVVDDRCPDGTGEFVQSNTKDKRITVIRHEKNLGVGGATLTGYKAALETNAEIIVKVDGDGQMDQAQSRGRLGRGGTVHGCQIGWRAVQGCRQGTRRAA